MKIDNIYLKTYGKDLHYLAFAMKILSPDIFPEELREGDGLVARAEGPQIVIEGTNDLTSRIIYEQGINIPKEATQDEKNRDDNCVNIAFVHRNFKYRIFGEKNKKD